MKLIENNGLAKQAGSAAAPLMARLGRELMAAIPKGKDRQQAYLVLRQLATAAEFSEEGEMQSTALSTKEITTEISPGRDPSGLMSRLWPMIQGPSGFPAMQENLIRRCRTAGLSHYPVPVKEEGSPAYYFLKAEPLPPESATAGDVVPSPGPGQDGIVTYEADMTLRLSRLGRILFGERGLVWTARVRYLITGGVAAGWMVLAIACVLSVLALSFRRTPISISDVINTGLAIGLVYWAYRWVEGIKLFDDRIVVAPQWALAWSEDGATLEIERAADSHSPSTMHVRRYTAVCPVCSGIVKVRSGEPDFPRRLVGRCENSPREHVFGFDRITREGARMPLPGATRADVRAH